MSYQTGVPTDETDLVKQLVTWLVSLGWTNNLSAADGGAGWRAHLSKGGMFVNLRSAINDLSGGVWPPVLAGGRFVGVMLNVGTGFDGSHAWYDQAGVPTQNTSPQPSGVGFSTQNTALASPFSMAPFTRYHFFSDALDNVVVVLERSPGNFSVMGWGNLIKKGGVWTGGAYFFSRVGPVYSSTTILPTCECPFTFSGYSNNDNAAWVRADVDTYIGKWLSNYRDLGGGGLFGKRCATGVSFVDPPPPDIPSYAVLATLLTSQLNSQANLLPIDVYGERDNPSNPGQIGGGFSLLGTVPGIFLTTAGSRGFASGSIYSIGADDYMIFAGAMAPASWIPGFAIKKT